MAVTYEQSRQGYINLWEKAVIRPERLGASRTWAATINRGRARYEKVQQLTGVYWAFVGLIHMREGSCDFGTYLGNGEPLSSVTHLVPAGRGPFATFEAGAVDALIYQGFTKFKGWPISRMLWGAENLNGEGYFERGINDPYVWCWTQLYGTPPNVGKYVGDGVWSSTAIDQQPGIAAVLGALITINTDVANYLASYKEEPVSDTTITIPVAPAPAPIPLPAGQRPPSTPPTAEPLDAIIEILKAAGKWPGIPTVTITTSGVVSVIVNGKVVQ